MTFVRTTKEWSLENFNEGHVMNKGRFLVYLPSHPRAYASGYILRSIVAYEAYYGEPVPKGYVIHHVDGNRLNDSKDNLKKLLFGEHSSLHNESRKVGSVRRCYYCGQDFYIPQWRLNQSRHRGKYCSRTCMDAGSRRGDVWEQRRKI